MLKTISKPTFFVVCYVVFFACGDLNLGQNNGFGSVSGTVYNQSFSEISGAADKLGSTYTITLANTSEFSCSSQTPTPSNYLLVDIPNIEDMDQSQTFSASGAVFFNKVEEDVADSSGATSGTVTIESIDGFTIAGSLSASGPDGDISGSFSVEICN